MFLFVLYSTADAIVKKRARNVRAARWFHAGFYTTLFQFYVCISVTDNIHLLLSMLLQRVDGLRRDLQSAKEEHEKVCIREM